LLIALCVLTSAARTSIKSLLAVWLDYPLVMAVPRRPDAARVATRPTPSHQMTPSEVARPRGRRRSGVGRAGDQADDD
jgi:hypothetical protein